jgi:hypothetical protein
MAPPSENGDLDIGRLLLMMPSLEASADASANASAAGTRPSATHTRRHSVVSDARTMLAPSTSGVASTETAPAEAPTAVANANTLESLVRMADELLDPLDVLEAADDMYINSEPDDSHLDDLHSALAAPPHGDSLSLLDEALEETEASDAAAPTPGAADAAAGVDATAAAAASSSRISLTASGSSRSVTDSRAAAAATALPRSASSVNKGMEAARAAQPARLPASASASSVKRAPAVAEQTDAVREAAVAAQPVSLPGSASVSSVRSASMLSETRRHSLTLRPVDARAPPPPPPPTAAAPALPDALPASVAEDGYVPPPPPQLSEDPDDGDARADQPAAEDVWLPAELLVEAELPHVDVEMSPEEQADPMNIENEPAFRRADVAQQSVRARITRLKISPVAGKPESEGLPLPDEHSAPPLPAVPPTDSSWGAVPEPVHWGGDDRSVAQSAPPAVALPIEPPPMSTNGTDLATGAPSVPVSRSSTPPPLPSTPPVVVLPPLPALPAQPSDGARRPPSPINVLDRWGSLALVSACALDLKIFMSRLPRSRCARTARQPRLSTSSVGSPRLELPETPRQEPGSPATSSPRSMSGISREFIRLPPTEMVKLPSGWVGDPKPTMSTCWRAHIIFCGCACGDHAEIARRAAVQSPFTSRRGSGTWTGLPSARRRRTAAFRCRCALASVVLARPAERLLTRSPQGAKLLRGPVSERFLKKKHTKAYGTL